MSTRRILITGAAGGVGTILTQRLKDDYDITGHDLVAQPEADPLILGADLADYDAGRGFTLDFAEVAPGPILQDQEALTEHLLDWARHGEACRWLNESMPMAFLWRARFVPHDDGRASQRVVDGLVELGALPPETASAPGAGDDDGESGPTRGGPQ